MPGPDSCRRKGGEAAPTPLSILTATRPGLHEQSISEAVMPFSVMPYPTDVRPMTSERPVRHYAGRAPSMPAATITTSAFISAVFRRGWCMPAIDIVETVRPGSEKFIMRAASSATGISVLGRRQHDGSVFFYRPERCDPDLRPHHIQSPQLLRRRRNADAHPSC